MTLQEKVLGYAGRPEAETALFLSSLGETMFVPVAADELLISMVLVNDDLAFRYAMMATAGSVVGGIANVIIGFMVYGLVGIPLIQGFHLQGLVSFLSGVFSDYNVLLVVAAGVATIPYKIITLISGFFRASLVPLVVASVVSRGARYFLIAWLLWRGGGRYKTWIDSYFNGLTTVMALGLLMVFVMILLLVQTA